MKIWKQLLRPDIWYKTARGWFCPSKADCREYCSNTKKALANGVPISVPLEHHLECVPARALSRDEAMAAMVGLNTGFVDDLRTNLDGSLDVLLDVDWVPDGNGQPIRDDAEIKARLAKSIKFVSPFIVADLVDGHGVSYGKGIAHVALTAQPVDHGQQPFALSKSVALGRGLFLSIANSRSMSTMATKLLPLDKPADPKTDAEPMAAPESTDELLEQLKGLIEEAGDDVAEAIRSCHEHLTTHHPDKDEEDEEETNEPGAAGEALPAAPVPSYTALSRGGVAEDHGDAIARRFPRTSVPGLAKNKNSH
jgi:hypothetical protein